MLNLNGRALFFTLLLASCRRSPAATESRASTLPTPHDHSCDCALPARDFERHAACLQREGAAYRMQPSVLRILTQQREPGPFDLYSQCGMFWVRADGLALPTPNFDNGPDPFQEGITRYLSNGKYGYMTPALNVLVAPSYEFAYPFEQGRGVVCRGCTFSSQGEHTAVACSRCGAVDQRGQLVVPLGNRSPP